MISEGMIIKTFPDTDNRAYKELIRESGYDCKIEDGYIVVGEKLEKSVNKEKLGRALCLARREKGLKLQEVADLIGVHWQTIYDWEVGLRQPRDINLKRFCRVVGISAKETLDNATE